jgi:hypothetical protein
MDEGPKDTRLLRLPRRWSGTGAQPHCGRTSQARTIVKFAKVEGSSKHQCSGDFARVKKFPCQKQRIGVQLVNAAGVRSAGPGALRK